jgi:hypothetical protein
MEIIFQTSESTAKLDAAIAKAQGEIDPAAKDKVNPHFRSRYADLTSIWEACRKALSKHGISVTQWPLHSDDNRLHIITRLAHDGEWMMARFSLPVSKHDAHGVGSAATYGKRYALSAALGVVSDEDDDGNKAVEAAPPKAAKEPDKEGAGLLRGAKTLDELQDIWRSLKPDQRASLGPLKDDCKAKILRENEALQP